MCLKCPPTSPCHFGALSSESLALDRTHWSNHYVSPLEIHEHFARDVVYGKRAPGIETCYIMSLIMVEIDNCGYNLDISLLDEF